MRVEDKRRGDSMSVSSGSPPTSSSQSAVKSVSKVIKNAGLGSVNVSVRGAGVRCATPSEAESRWTTTCMMQGKIKI